MRRSRFSKASAAVMALAAALGLGGQARADGTLYDSLGGKPGVELLSARSVSLYMNDPRLRSYFGNINPDFLRARFVVFFCNVTDGGCPYHGRSMGATHRGLHVDEAAFDAVVEDLQQALRDQGIPFHTQNRLLARLAPMERAIVTR